MEEKRGEKEARVVWKKRKGKMEGGGFPVGRPRRSGSTHKTWKHVISPRRGGQSMVCRFFHPPCSSLPSFPFLFLALLLCHCRASIRFTVPPLFRITETNTRADANSPVETKSQGDPSLSFLGARGKGQRSYVEPA